MDWTEIRFSHCSQTEQLAICATWCNCQDFPFVFDEGKKGMQNSRRLFLFSIPLTIPFRQSTTTTFRHSWHSKVQLHNIFCRKREWSQAPKAFAVQKVPWECSTSMILLLILAEFEFNAVVGMQIRKLRVIRINHYQP